MKAPGSDKGDGPLSAFAFYASLPVPVLSGAQWLIDATREEPTIQRLVSIVPRGAMEVLGEVTIHLLTVSGDCAHYPSA